MPTAIVNSGDQILFVAPSTSDQKHLVDAKSAFQNQVGSDGIVAFEAMERVSEGTGYETGCHGSFVRGVFG
jgi:hypothetical protein